MFFEANLGNPKLYPGTEALETKVIRMLSALLHGKGIYGHIVNGGNEANITALWLARNNRKKKKVIFAKSAHFSILKACDILNMEPVPVGLDRQYRLDASEAGEKLDDDVCAVVGVAGTTELGAVDPIPELSELCRGRAHLHIDAAFGGFVLPFMRGPGNDGCDGHEGYDAPEFDFRLPGVTSISVDPHKMGLATIPSGAFLVRGSEDIRKIAVPTPYLTSELQASISGTRASGAVAGTYAVMRLLGMDGYRKIIKKCMGNTYYLRDRIVEMGLKPVLDPPPMNILGVRVKNLERVYNELAQAGWFVSAANNPRCLRLVVMPHITRASVDNFAARLEKTCRRAGAL
jgi:tyrosine decarboxylase/aspartate 1-decarboxylase